MLKLLGTLILLFGAGGFSLSLILRQQEHLDRLMDMRCSLIRMKQQVVYIGMSAPSILEREVEYGIKPLADFYRHLLMLLEKKRAIHFYEALEHSTMQSDIRPFSTEEWGIFLKAMESLFSLEQAREEQAFEGYLKQLDDCIRQEQEAKKEKRKVTLSLTMMGAAMVLLLLL